MDYKSNILICDLFDIYSNLLTDKQKVVFKDYYFNNLSLSEIAENNNISRQAVDFTLKNVIKALNSFENNLSIKKKNDLIINLINAVKSKVADHEIINDLNNIVSKIKE